MPANANEQFDAFICHSRMSDLQLARKLEAFLERVHTLPSPNDQTKNITDQPLRICVDGSDFDLSENIPAQENESPVHAVLRHYLTNSKALIVLCSRGAASHKSYVNWEIECFIRLHPQAPIYIAVTEGSPTIDPESVFPKAILSRGLHEKLWYDLRGFDLTKTPSNEIVEDFENAQLQLAASLLGPGITVSDIAPLWFRQQREEQKSRARTAIGFGMVMACLAIIAVYAAYTAYNATILAQQRLRVVNAERLVAESNRLQDKEPVQSLLLAIEALRATTPDGIRLDTAQTAARDALNQFNNQQLVFTSTQTIENMIRLNDELIGIVQSDTIHTVRQNHRGDWQIHQKIAIPKGYRNPTEVKVVQNYMGTSGKGGILLFELKNSILKQIQKIKTAKLDGHAFQPNFAIDAKRKRIIWSVGRKIKFLNIGQSNSHDIGETAETVIFGLTVDQESGKIAAGNSKNMHIFSKQNEAQHLMLGKSIILAGLKWLANSQILFVGSSSGEINLIKDEKLILKHNLSFRVASYAWNQEENQLLVGGSDGKITLLQYKLGKFTETKLHGKLDWPANDIGFSPDNQFVYASGRSKAQIWCLNPIQPENFHRLTGLEPHAKKHLFYKNDVMTLNNYALRQHHLAHVCKTRTAHSSYILDPNDKTLLYFERPWVILQKDGEIIDRKKGYKATLLTQHINGYILANYLSDRTHLLFHKHDSLKVLQIPFPAYSANVSKDASMIFTGDLLGHSCIYDYKTIKKIGLCHRHTKPILFTAIGKKFAISSDVDGSKLLFQTSPNLTLLDQWQSLGPSAATNMIRVSANEKYVFESSVTGQIRVFEISNNKLIKLEGFKNHGPGLPTFAFDEKFQRLATTGGDLTIRVFKLDNPTQPGILTAMSAYSRVLRFLHPWLVAGDALGNVWAFEIDKDVNTLSKVRLGTAKSSISDIQFAPGKHAVLVSARDTLYTFALPTTQAQAKHVFPSSDSERFLLLQSQKAAGRNFTAIEWIRFMGQGEWQALFPNLGQPEQQTTN